MRCLFGRAAWVDDVALAHQRQADVRERREVAAAADGAVARNHGRDAFVEHRQQRLGEQRPHTGHAHRQRAGAQEHGRTHDLDVDWRPDARGVGADECQLKLGLAERRDARAG